MWILPAVRELDGELLGRLLLGRANGSRGRPGCGGSSPAPQPDVVRAAAVVARRRAYRQLFHLMALFPDVVDVRVLLLLRDLLPTHVIPPLPWHTWLAFLEACRACGLVKPLGKQAFRLRSGVPAVALTWWRRAEGTRFLQVWDTAARALGRSCADMAEAVTDQMRTGLGTRGMASAILHHRTLATLAFRALHGHDIDVAGTLLGPLSALWVRERLFSEASQWSTRVRPFVFSLGGGASPSPRAAGKLWDLVFRARREQVLLGGTPSWRGGEGAPVVGEAGLDLRLASAAATELSLLARYRAEGDLGGVANCHLVLGDLSWAAGDLPRAESSYMRALGRLDLLEDLGGQAHLFCTLGRLAREKGDLNGSDFWLNRAMRTAEVARRRRDMQAAACSLAVNAVARGDMRSASALLEAAIHFDRSRAARGDAPPRAHANGVPPTDRPGTTKPGSH